LLRRNRRHGTVGGGRICVLLDPRLDGRTEIADQALDRPCSRIAKRADGVTLDLLGHLEQHVDFALLSATLDHAFHDSHHPACALAARRALTAALVLEEGRDAPDGFDNVGGLVHDNHAAGAEARLLVPHAVKIHDGVHHVFTTDHGARGTAGDYGQQVVPAAADAAAMLFNDVLEAFAKGLFEGCRPVHVTRDHEELGAHIV